jgi:nucleoside-diphosphate-sugar epimerase
MKILVTGCTGYIGAALLKTLSEGGEFCAIGASRQIVQTRENDIFSVGEMDDTADWKNVLNGVDVVIHAAGVAHRLRDRTNDLKEDYRRINVEGTLNLANQAVRCGVKRLIYISSIGVNGLNSPFGKSFSEIDEPSPQNEYSLSKLQAEKELLQLSSATGLEVVIIRPPLVYGYKAPGNFDKLKNALRSRWLLPLKSVNNSRSFIALDNLVDFILACVRHEAAANQIFLVSDGVDISTPELISSIAEAMKVRARLISFPIILLKISTKLLGRSDAFNGLCGNLQINISKANKLLGWTPPLSFKDGIRRAVNFTLSDND